MVNSTVQKSIYKFREKRKFSGRNILKDNKVFNEIKTKRDIYRSREIVQNHITTYNSKSYNVGQDDIEDLKKAFGEFEIAISKAINFYENNRGITKEELIELIECLFSFYDDFGKIKIKNTFR
ncbi:hypothetical protein [Priestia megaterium]|uniref:hypothetical protein n=1 Tax=Priestia megaterium TaxID=1404 RepID=UPI001F12CAB6|nr:hypothetical protein [Priestia megaterium]UMZ36008.1 hypothetical protein MGJ28_28110 [Priestia megaterium]